MTVLALLILLNLLRRQILSLRRATALSLELSTSAAATAVALSALCSRHAAIALLGLALNLALRAWLRVGDRTRNRIGRVVNVEVLLNDLGDGLDLSTKLLLYPVQIEPVFPVDQVDGQTQVSESTGTTDSVQVSLGVLREVKVDDNIDSLNINTTSQQIRADKVSTHAISKIVEHPVTVVLKHTSMRVEARISEFSNLLGQQLDTVG